ncbi:MAG: PD-(D/E)XK nuclease family protein, partial [Lapillicoccus sp.]
MTCPLLYRFRVIDRLPSAPSPAAARGTLVHAVLERLFDLPAADRTPERAAQLLGPEWERLVEGEPALAGLLSDDGLDGPDHTAWLADASRLVDSWFTLEDPTRLEPA